MAKIDVYTSEMSALSARLKSISSTIENAERVTGKVQSNLDFRIAALENIAGGLSRAKQQLRRQKDKVVKMSNLTNRSVSEFRAADGQMDKNARNVLRKIVTLAPAGINSTKQLSASVAISRHNTVNSFFKPAGTIITIVGIRELIRRLAQIIKGAKQEQEKRQQQDKDQRELDIINERYKTLPSANKGFKGACGAFVFQQLLMQGIVTKTGAYESTLHGKDYAKVLAKKKVTSTGYKITNYGDGDNAFDNFLEATKGKSPLTNIVCSFKKGTTTSNTEDGHTMLISKIENGKVYYVDNRSECRQPDGSYAARCITIEEFKQLYFSAGNNCTGITQLG